jgi:ribosomal protein S27E
MQTAATHAKPRRGVICRHCGKPIRLSATLLKRELNITIAPTLDPALYSRVFPVRCRHCHKEAIYALDQIADL